MARFIRRGITVVRFAPTLATPKVAVIRSEITSSTNLTDSIAEMNGWMLEGSDVAVPDMGSRFDKNIPGTRSAANSSLTFYEDDSTGVIETLLPLDTAGFILLMRKGDKPTTPSLDIFPVRVRSRSAEFSAGNDPARFMVQFSITDEPKLDTVIPAAP